MKTKSFLNIPKDFESDVSSRNRSVFFLVFFLIVLFLFVSNLGCNGVRRRLTIRSEPPGALVYLNNQEIGRTPVSQNIVYSGDYSVRVIKDGFETETVYHKVKTPWYLWPGVDFVSENFVPGEIRDDQVCQISMEPRRMIPANELREQAIQLRAESQSNGSLRSYSSSFAAQSQENILYPQTDSSSTTALSEENIPTPAQNVPSIQSTQREF